MRQGSDQERKRRSIHRSLKSHVLRPAAGLWPKRGSRRRDETERDGDSAVPLGRFPHFGKCRPPKRDRPSLAKISYPLLQDISSCEYRRECLTFGHRSWVRRSKYAASLNSIRRTQIAAG